MGEDPRFRRDIPLHPAVSLQMIGAHIGQDGHIGREAGRQVQLIARDLDHIDRARRRSRKRQHADADVAADVNGHPRLFQHPADEGRGGRLAVGAGDGDHLGPLPLRQRRDRSREQFNVADDLDPGRLRLANGPVRLRMGQGRARRQDQRRETGPVGAGQVLDREPFRLGLHPAGHAVVPQHRQGPARLERARRCKAGAAEPEDGDATAFKAGDEDH